MRDVTGDDQLVRLEAYTGPWAADDPDANFKHDVSLYSRLDPLLTLRNMSANIGVPVGALARYVLAKWATAGSGALMELGADAVRRLWAPIERAERAGTDAARLAAYDELRQLVSWLKVPLDDEGVYPLPSEASAE